MKIPRLPLDVSPLTEGEPYMVGGKVIISWNKEIDRRVKISKTMKAKYAKKK